MIEKYFQMGMRYKWTKPNDAMCPTDGKVVDSTQSANQLVYDGLDGELINPKFMQINVSTLGLTMRQPVQHEWLDYAPGRTARVPVAGYDVLTGYMSGCRLAYWSNKGVRFAGHLGTIDSMPSVNNAVKTAFAAQMGLDARAFNPAAAWPPSEITPLLGKFKTAGLRSYHIFGLITSQGNFFSVLMFREPPNLWCVGGIKAVPPTQYAELKTFCETAGR